MPRNADYKLQVKGLLYTVRGKGRMPLKRMIVSSSFKDLFSLIEENKFDVAIWNNLLQVEKNFMYYLNNKLKEINSEELNKLHCKESDDELDRLRLLEGSMYAGNDNPILFTELDNVLTDLESKYLIPSITANKLRKHFKILSDNNKDNTIENRLCYYKSAIKKKKDKSNMNYTNLMD